MDTDSLISRERAELIERNKELSCLYEIAKVEAEAESMSLEDMFAKIVRIIPGAFQFPELAAARITVFDKFCVTTSKHKFTRRMSRKIFVGGKVRGVVDVFYQNTDKGDFLAEEGALMEAVARHLSLILHKKEEAERRSELELQLRHADRLATIGELAAGIAHELNEPLANILGFAQLMTKNAQLPEQSQRDVESIVKASLHAREIIKKLMLFSRQMPQRKENVNLNTVVEEGFFFIEARCVNGNVRVIKELDDSLPDIKADPSQLHQVLVNLVINALHAMPDGGELYISTAVQNDYVRLSVRDTGEGIEKKIIKQIFNPFFTTKDIDKGTGLGLSVVHGIITAHGGKIEVHSRKGEGALFEVLLPCG
jgi:signal transduction histidine kinase